MSAASPSPLMPRPERLLVVEDDVFSQDLIALYLRKAGFSDITVTGDGREALEIAKSRTFDLVLLDLNLPRLSGTEVLRRLRKEGFLTDTPVIVISSLANMEDTLTCLDLGAEDSLPKPFNVRLLEGRVSACLEKARLKTAARLAVDRAEGERRLALALMESLCRVALPPPGPGFAAEVAVERRPCGGPGGDVVVSLAPPGGRVVVALGTLAARGVEGTLIAARLHAALRATLDDTPDASPEVLLTRVAAAAGRDGAGGRVLVASLDPTDGTLLVSSAGAIDPVVIRPGAPPRPLIWAL
ncbi:response regulator [Pararhodospirillum photometricum]|uniref:response regulator n=1 Tax=Pararhodospirillum photometricum TaxID=1084 RepID=UPI00030E6D01|nr:response regulator [Pararhodospirillum photometricum]